MSHKFLRILTATVIVSLALFGMAGADAWNTVGTSYYLNPGHSLYATGASGFNFSQATGIFKLPSGVFTMTNGAAIPAGKDLTMAAGAGKLIVGTGGINTTSGILELHRAINVSSLTGPSKFYSAISAYAPITIVGTAGLTAGGNIDGAKVNASGTSRIAGAVYDMSTLGVTGNAAFNNLTVNSTKALVVTSADKLTVGGVVIPQKNVISLILNSSLSDGALFIPDEKYTITDAEIRTTTNTSGAVTLLLKKCLVTVAPSAGTSIGSAFNLSAAPNVVNAQVNPTSGTLNASDTLCMDITGNSAALRGGVLTIHLKRTV